MKKQLEPGVDAVLRALSDKLAALSDWNPDAIQAAINAVCEDLELKLGKVGPPLRLAVAGTPMSPGLDITLNLVGQPRTLERINKAIEAIETMA